MLKLHLAQFFQRGGISSAFFMATMFHVKSAIARIMPIFLTWTQLLPGNHLIFTSILARCSRGNTKLALNARADTSSTLIMWMGSFIAMIIIVIWLAGHFYPTQAKVEEIQANLDDLKIELNSACTSTYYHNAINPSIEDGSFVVNDSSICISFRNLTSCTSLICFTGVTQSFNLSSLTYLVIEKNESFTITFQ